MSFFFKICAKKQPLINQHKNNSINTLNFSRLQLRIQNKQEFSRTDDYLYYTDCLEELFNWVDIDKQIELLYTEWNDMLDKLNV